MVDNNISTSSTLLELCRKNDVDGWKRLMELYKKLIYYWLDLYNVPVSDRDDVFQNVLVKMAKSIRFFRKKEKGKFRNWLRTVVHSLSMNYHNERKKRLEELDGNMDNQRSCDPDYDFDSDSGSDSDSEARTMAPSDYGLPEDPNVISASQRHREDYILKRNIKKLLEKKFQQVHVEAFFLTLETDQSSQEIGERLGLSSDNVRQIACRIRKYVRDNWEEVM